MSDIDDLLAWLSAVLDEDELVARAATDAIAAHIVGHDLADVLADVAVKRRILGLLAQVGANESQVEMEFGVGAVDLYPQPSEMIPRLIASAYADRPGYRQEWAP